MSKEQLKHIFEQSACLTARQLKGYVSGTMVHEEAHAVEAHLLSCPFCSDAVEGMMAAKSNGSVAAIGKLDSGFIAKELGITVKEIKAATPPPSITANKTYKAGTEEPANTKSRVMWRPIAAAAAFAGIVAVMWLMRDTIFPQGDEQKLAEQLTIEEPKPVQQEITYQQPTTDSIALVVEADITEETEANDEIAAAVPATTALTADAAKANKDAEKKLTLPPAAKTAEQARLLDAGKEKSTRDVAASAVKYDGQQRMGNSFTGPESYASAPASTNVVQEVKAADEEVTMRKGVKPEVQQKISEHARSGIDKGDDLYNKGKYKRALKAYQDEMYDSRSNKRDGATYMAAKCHLALGEDTQARTLLNSLIHSNSSKKGQAEQLLRDMEP